MRLWCVSDYSAGQDDNDACYNNASGDDDDADADVDDDDDDDDDDDGPVLK